MTSSIETSKRRRRKIGSLKHAPKYSPRAMDILDKIKTAASRNTTGVNRKLLDEAAHLAFGVSAPKAPPLSTHTFEEEEQIKGIIDVVTDPKPPQPGSALPNALLADILGRIEKSNANTPTTSVPSVPIKPLIGPPPPVPLLDVEEEEVADLAQSEAARGARGLGEGISPDFEPKPSESEVSRDQKAPDRHVSNLHTIEGRLNVARLSNAVRNAIVAGDQASLDKLVANDDFFLSLDFDAVKRAYARGIKDSEDEDAAHTFLKKNFPRGGSEELEQTMEQLYGDNETMLKAFIDTPLSHAPANLASVLVPDRIMSQEEINVWKRKDVERFGSAEDRADQDEAERLSSTKPPRLITPEFALQQEINAALDAAAAGDGATLADIAKNRTVPYLKIEEAILNRRTMSGEENSKWINLLNVVRTERGFQRAHDDIWQQADTIPGVPEKGSIRKFFEWYGGLSLKDKAILGGAIGGGVGLGLAIGGIGSAWLAGVLAARGVGGVVGGSIAGATVAKWTTKMAEKYPKFATAIHVATSVVGGVAGSLLFGKMAGSEFIQNVFSKGESIPTPSPAPAPAELSVPPTPKPAPAPFSPPGVEPPTSDTPPDIDTKPTPPATPGGKALPNVPAPETGPTPAPIVSGESYVVGPGDTVGRLGLWGSLTELLRTDSFLSKGLALNNIFLPHNLQESLAMAVNQVLHENPGLLKLLSPDVDIIETANGLKSIVPTGAVFSGPTIEDSWKNLFLDSDEFKKEFAKLISKDGTYKSLYAALTKAT